MLLNNIRMSFHSWNYKCEVNDVIEKILLILLLDDYNLCWYWNLVTESAVSNITFQNQRESIQPLLEWPQ